MQTIQQLLQLGQMLAMNQGFNQTVAGIRLAGNKIFDQLMPMQQLDHLLKVRLGSGSFFLFFSHRRFQWGCDCVICGNILGRSRRSVQESFSNFTRTHPIRRDWRRQPDGPIRQRLR
jgi:hypothetical protein